MRALIVGDPDYNDRVDIVLTLNAAAGRMGVDHVLVSRSGSLPFTCVQWALDNGLGKTRVDPPFDNDDYDIVIGFPDPWERFGIEPDDVKPNITRAALHTAHFQLFRVYPNFIVHDPNEHGRKWSWVLSRGLDPDELSNRKRVTSMVTEFCFSANMLCPAGQKNPLMLESKRRSDGGLTLTASIITC